MKWYERLGYGKDPFSPSSIAGSEELLEDIAYHVRAGSMVLLIAPPGAGKTQMLQELIRLFRGRKRVIYVDAGARNGYDIESLMTHRHGTLGRLLRIIPRDMILLVDNVSSLSRRNAEKLKFFFDNDYLHAVVFAAESVAQAKLPDGILDRIGSKVLAIPHFTEDAAVETVKNCLESSFFPEEMVRKLYARSHEPRQFLENCSKVCEAAVKADAEHVEAAHLAVVKHG